MTTIYVVRHGNTFDPGQTVRRIGGGTDMALSLSGLHQARLLAERFQDTPFRAAICSPLLRTRQTARAILAARQDAPPLLIEPFLREVDYGPDENRPETEVQARLGPALDAWDRDGIVPAQWPIDIARIRHGWQALLERAAGLGEDARLLVVTSNGIARFLPDVVDEGGQGLQRKLATGAWGEVVAGDGRSRITAWNVRPGPGQAT